MANNNIKISIDAPVLPDGANLTHVSTSWQLSRYPDFSLTEYLVYESLEDTEKLTTLFYSNADLSTSLYCRTRYHFDNGLACDWSRTIPVKSDQIGLKLSNTVVITPIAQASVDVKRTSSTVTIETNPFKLYNGVGNHSATTWVIQDSLGNKLLNREKDADNLTKLTIDASMLDADKVYFVKAKHHTDTNSDSNFGTYLLGTDIKSDNVFEAEVVGIPISNSLIYLRVSMYKSDFYTVDVIIKDVNGLTIKVNLDQPTLNPTIDTDGLNLTDTYCIEVRVKFTNGVYTPYHNVWCGRLYNNDVLPKDPNAVYLNDYTYTHELFLKGATAQSSIELYDGTILLTKQSDNNIYRYTMYSDNLVETSIAGELTGSDDIMDRQYVNIIPLVNGRVLIDYNAISIVHSGSPLYQQVLDDPTQSGLVTLVDDGENIVKYAPRFALFDYDPVGKVLNLIKMVSRRDELYGSAVTNSMGVIGNYMYYVPGELVNSDTLSIRRLDVTTLDIVVLAEHPVSDVKANLSLSTIDDNTLLVLGGSYTPTEDDNHALVSTRVTNKIYSYNIAANIYTEVATLPSGLSLDVYSIQAYVMRNYNIVLFNGVSGGPLLGDQSSAVYNVTTNEVTLYANDNFDSMSYRNTIRLRNGDILRISSRISDPQIIYMYPVERTEEIAIIENNEVDVVTDLVVAANNITYIENPYMYDTITINGTSDDDTGLLQWQSGDEILEFRYRDLLLTRDTTMTESETEQYDTITQLEGVTLTVVED